MKNTNKSAPFINTDLRDQLKNAIRDKKIIIKYPAHYKKWKKKFDYWFNITHDVKQTLEILYGPDGSADNYKGSIYTNANFDIKAIENSTKRPHRQPHRTHANNKPTTNGKSSAFNFIRLKRNGQSGKDNL